MPRARYRANTNLEQISDWLTKILVGVGLTQLAKVPGALGSAADRFGGALGGGDAGGPCAIAIILFFMTSGFLFGYLWTRIYLASALEEADPAAEMLDAAAAVR